MASKIQTFKSIVHPKRKILTDPYVENKRRYCKELFLSSQWDIKTTLDHTDIRCMKSTETSIYSLVWSNIRVSKCYRIFLFAWIILVKSNFWHCIHFHCFMHQLETIKHKGGKSESLRQCLLLEMIHWRLKAAWRAETPPPSTACVSLAEPSDVMEGAIV